MTRIPLPRRLQPRGGRVLPDHDPPVPGAGGAARPRVPAGVLLRHLPIPILAVRRLGGGAGGRQASDGQRAAPLPQVH